MNMRPFTLYRYGFLLSLLLVLYGALFPFSFDLANFSTSHFSLLPFWDAERGRIHSIPDMVSNVLLTMPLGFFGTLWLGGKRKLTTIGGWFLFGLTVGILAEVAQLAIPSRLSDITDALNNGLGSMAGSIIACLFGKGISDLFSGTLFEIKDTYFFIVIFILGAGMLLPFDFTMDVSHFGSSLRQLWTNPWEKGMPIQDEWIQMAEFGILGALAGRIAKYRIILLALALPFILESMQFLVESHAPSVRDLFMNALGVVCGITIARTKPSLARPAAGFAVMNLAIIAQGLSPYHLAARSHFEWVPLVEYYNQTTGAALYDAMSGLLIYGLLTTLWPRKATILWAVLLAAGIECVQTFIPARSAGITDILIAGLGACSGYAIFHSIEDYAGYTEIG